MAVAERDATLNSGIPPANPGLTGQPLWDTYRYQSEFAKLATAEDETRCRPQS